VLFYSQNSTIDSAKGDVILIKEFNQKSVLQGVGGD
jgi:hypothetical protein